MGDQARGKTFSILTDEVRRVLAAGGLGMPGLFLPVWRDDRKRRDEFAEKARSGEER